MEFSATSTVSQANMEVYAIVDALNCISGNTSSNRNNDVLRAHTFFSAGQIKEAESNLLFLEESDPDIYATMLLNIIILPPDFNGSVAPRLAALLSLKAAISRRWINRARRKNLAKIPMFHEKTKSHIRTALLSLVTCGNMDHTPFYITFELSSILANDRSLQASLAFTLSKIVKLDVPFTFHELAPTLVRCTTATIAFDNFNKTRDSKNIITVKINAANTLEIVLEEICSKRLLVDKEYVLKLSKNRITILATSLIHVMNYLSAGLNSSAFLNSDNFISVTSHAKVLTKIIRHLLLASFTSLLYSKEQNTEIGAENIENMIDQFFSSVLQFISLVKTKISNISVSSNGYMDLAEELKDLMQEQCQMVINVQKKHAVAFVPIISPFVVFFHKELHCASTRLDDVINASFLFLAITFLSNVAGCAVYSSDASSNKTMGIDVIKCSDAGGRIVSSEGIISAEIISPSRVKHIIWEELLTVERISVMIDDCLRLMKITKEELMEWKDDAESFHLKKLNAVMEDGLSSYAQNLYLTLVESKIGCSLVERKILPIIQNVNDQISVANIEAGYSSIPGKNVIPDMAVADLDEIVLELDTIYMVVGLSLTSMRKWATFDLNEWLEVCIFPCMKSILSFNININRRLPILRRRLIWLIGCSSHVLKNRQYAFEAIAYVLVNKCRENDIIVRLTAVGALNSLLYDSDGLIDTFAQYSDSVISSLYALANECSQLECCEEILSCINLLLMSIKEIGKHIGDNTADIVVGPLVSIWENALEQKSHLRGNVLSILSCVATSVGTNYSQQQLHPIALPMISTSLGSTARNMHPFLIEDALNLWLTLVRQLSVSDPNLENIFGIIVTLLADGFEHTRMLMMIAEGYLLIGDISFLERNSSMIQHLLQSVIGKVAPIGEAYVFLVIESLLRKFPLEGGLLLLKGGILKDLLKFCSQNFFKVDSCEPDRVIILYLTTLARVLLYAPQFSDEILHACQQDGEAQFGYEELIQLYFRLFKHAGSHSSGFLQQKIWIIFFLSMLPPNSASNLLQKQFFMNIDSLLNNCLIALKNSKYPLRPYAVAYDDEEETCGQYNHLHSSIINSAFQRDTCHTQDIGKFLELKMKEFRSAVGEERYSELLQRVDPSILQQLKEQLEK